MAFNCVQTMRRMVIGRNGPKFAVEELIFGEYSLFPVDKANL